MKILKIFGIVAGIHLFALILIFANPGCSSSTRPAPTPMDTVGRSEPGPQITVPPPSDSSLLTPAPVSFNPDAPAVAAGSGGIGRYSPTRPNTPTAGALLAESPADITPATTHQVKSGESIDAIARRYGVRSAEIVKINNIKDAKMIKPGQKLIIPSKPVAKIPPAAPAATAAGAVPVETTPKPAANQLKHTVQSGESLSVIARRYGVKVGDIALLNNISDPRKVQSGTELIIPEAKSTKSGGASTTASKSGAETPASSTPAPATPPTIAPPPPVEQTPVIDIPVIRVDESPLTPAPRNP